MSLRSSAAPTEARNEGTEPSHADRMKIKIDSDAGRKIITRRVGAGAGG
jgi:hypothetical protein